jgi:hypothetical protein
MRSLVRGRDEFISRSGQQDRCKPALERFNPPREPLGDAPYPSLQAGWWPTKLRSDGSGQCRTVIAVSAAMAPSTRTWISHPENSTSRLIGLGGGRAI